MLNLYLSKFVLNVTMFKWMKNGTEWRPIFECYDVSKSTSFIYATDLVKIATMYKRYNTRKENKKAD